MNTKTPFLYKTLIRETHLDTFGHVNNATYLELFEEARWDFITAAGYGLERIKSEQIGPVSLEGTVKYKKEIRNRELIVIESYYRGMNRSLSVELEQVMKKEDGSVAATLIMSFGVMDFRKRKLIVPTEGWIKAMGG